MSNRPQVLEDVPIPNGGKMSERVWDAADDQPESRPVSYSNSTMWLLPLNFSTRQFTVQSDRETAHYRNVTWNDLGPMIFTLPLRIRVADYIYKRGTERPVASRGVVMTPFWVQKFDKGDFGDDKEFYGFGVPLLFATLGLKDGETLNTKFFSSLWSLGPFMFKMENTVGRTYQKQYLAAPLLFGSWGGLLWIDIDFLREIDGDTNQRIVAHGPLLGLLGFWYQKSDKIYVTSAEDVANDRAEEEGEVKIVGEEAQRLILGGLLWQDSMDWDANDELTDARHGPLWTMFGWGKKDGRNTLRLFWIPIKL